MTQNFEQTSITDNFEGLLDDYQARMSTALKTGYNVIDEKSPLLQGLYLLGAMSSVGKTTFALNVSANICKCGVPVLFVSYEEQKISIACKDFSRYWFLKNYADNGRGADYTPTAQEIKCRKIKADMFADYVENLAKWKEEHKNFYFFRGTIEPASKLIETIKLYVKEKGVKFVVIDYLQIIPAEQEEIKRRVQLRERIDSAVQKLKALQEETGITLFIISSFNRENYKEFVSFESFKETGGLEYSADGLFGLQFKFDKKEKRDGDKIQQKRGEYPRTIEFVCLKNRYGETYSVDFEFFTRHDTFAKVGDIKIPKENRKTADNQQQENDDYDHE